MLAPARAAVRLALADAVHEWRMSLGLILAVVAIAAPLLLFFGLKYGTVNTLRKCLLNNPATLELLSVTEKLLDAAWFEARRADPRVAFLVPHTRKLSAQADVAPAGGGAAKRLDLHPSLPGDTLLARFGLEAPAADSCVLTSLAAECLNAKTGDRLAFTVTREQGRSKANHTFEVQDVLPARGFSGGGVHPARPVGSRGGLQGRARRARLRLAGGRSRSPLGSAGRAAVRPRGT